MTHKESIDVPDNWTIDESPESHRVGHIKAMVVYLKPLPPPEPPIDDCLYCGKRLVVLADNEHANQYDIYHLNGKGNCQISWPYTYPTRLAAIEAANRRAT